MIAPIPLEKVNAFIRELNHIGSTQTLTRDWTTFFHEKALAIRDSDIGQGDMALGMLAGMNGDAAEVKRRFKNAIAYLGHSPLVDYNYGLALSLAGDYGDAISVLAPYAEKDPEAALVMGSICERLGLKNRAEHYFEIAGHSTDKKQVKIQIRNREKFISGAVKKLATSMEEDREIWKSLSSR